MEINKVRKLKRKKDISLVTSLFLLTAIFLIYVKITWMSTTTPLGDWGRWHHEVDRFTNGEIPYKDFTWSYPPLSIYILGTIAYVFGSNFLVMQISTVFISAVVTVLTWLITHKILSKHNFSNIIILFISLGSILGGYTMFTDPTLSSGSYTPAVPIGFLFSLLLLYGVLQLLTKQSRFYFILSGLATAGCLLTKQEFWIFSLSIGIFMSIVLYFRNKHQGKLDKKGIFLYWLLSLGTTLLAFVSIAKDVGLSNLLAGMRGYLNIIFVFGRMIPSLRLLLDQLAMSTIFIIFFILAFHFSDILNQKLIKKMRLIGLIALLIGIISFGLIGFQTYNIANTILSSDVDSLSSGINVTTSSWSFYDVLSPKKIGLAQAVIGSIFFNTVWKHFLPGISLMFCALLFLWMFARKNNIHAKGISNIVIATIALAVLTLQIRRLFEYTESLLYFIAPIFIFIIVTKFTSKIKFNRRRFIIILTVSWFLIGSSLFFISIILPIITKPHYELNTEKGSIIAIGEKNNIQVVIDTITNTTKPDDYLLCLPYDSGLNYMTSRSNPIKITQFYHFNLSKQEELKAIQEIIQKQPLIVINERMNVYPSFFPEPSLSNMLSWEPERPVVAWRDIYPDLWKFIMNNYQCNKQIHPDWSICTIKSEIRK